MELFTKLSDRAAEQISGGAGNNVPRGIYDFENDSFNNGVPQSRQSAGIEYGVARGLDANGKIVSKTLIRYLPNGKTLRWGD